MPDDDDYNVDYEDGDNGLNGVDDDGVIGGLVRVGGVLRTFCLESLMVIMIISMMLRMIG